MSPLLSDTRFYAQITVLFEKSAGIICNRYVYMENAICIGGDWRRDWRNIGLRNYYKAFLKLFSAQLLRLFVFALQCLLCCDKFETISSLPICLPITTNYPVFSAILGAT